jgi:hypothetical protein
VAKLFIRTPVDLAVLKSIGKSENGSEQKVVEIFGEKDDVLADFEFNPIHLCVLNIHGYQHPERPSLEKYVWSTFRGHCGLANKA